MENQTFSLSRMNPRNLHQVSKLLDNNFISKITRSFPSARYYLFFTSNHYHPVTFSSIYFDQNNSNLRSGGQAWDTNQAAKRITKRSAATYTTASR